MKLMLILSLVLFFLAPSIGKLLFTDPTYSGGDLNFFKNIGPGQAKMQLLELIKKKPDKTDLWYEFVHAHFALKENLRNDEEFLKELEELEKIKNPDARENAIYAQGLFQVSKKNFDEGIGIYSKIKNQKLTFVKNSIGYAFFQKLKKASLEDKGEALDQELFERAKSCFLGEISLNGNLEAAIENLANLFLLAKNYQGVLDLQEHPGAKSVSPNSFRIAAYHMGNWKLYIRSSLKKIFFKIKAIGTLNALFIAGFWLIFLKKIDIFEPEKMGNLILVFGLGIFSCFCLVIPHDFFVETLKIKENLYDPPANLFYTLVVVGLLEELVKIIPLLVLIRFTKIINESVDFLIYAMASALGFAFLENLQYFGISTSSVIFLRAFSASTAHMVMSATAAYGFILAKNKVHYSFSPPVITFLIAAGMHGLYDFFLLTPQLSIFVPFVMIAWLFLIYRILRYTIVTALNQSEFFRESLAPNIEDVSRLFVKGLLGIYLFGYFSVAYVCGPSSAWEEFFPNGFLVLLLPWFFGVYVLEKRPWESMVAGHPINE